MKVERVSRAWSCIQFRSEVEKVEEKIRNIRESLNQLEQSCGGLWNFF